MRFIDLYDRILETTGLEVMTIGSLKASVANCFADLTSRGYRVFKEVQYTDNTLEGATYNGNLLAFAQPSDVRKVLYCRVFTESHGAIVANRYSISNKRVQSQFYNGAWRSVIPKGGAIFYIKGDTVYVEWDPALGTVTNISFGYYQRLTVPAKFRTLQDSDLENIDNLNEIEIDIREEFEDALVFYAAYFYYARYIKDTDKISLYLNNYKYYVEDITHELAYEDDYFEEDAVIKTYGEDY